MTLVIHSQSIKVIIVIVIEVRIVVIAVSYSGIINKKGENTSVSTLHRFYAQDLYSFVLKFWTETVNDRHIVTCSKS